MAQITISSVCSPHYSDLITKVNQHWARKVSSMIKPHSTLQTVNEPSLFFYACNQSNVTLNTGSNQQSVVIVPYPVS